MKKQQYSLARLLLTPSLVSGLGLGLLAVVVLVCDTWTYIDDHQLFYGYLVGPSSLSEFISQASSPSVSAWLHFLADSRVTYYILLCAFAAVVGLAVYTLLQVSGFIYSGSVELLHTTMDHRASQRSHRVELLLRFGLRLLAMAGWTVYMVATLSVLLPFTVALERLGLADFRNDAALSGIGCYVLAWLLLVITLHLHVVFMRLISLRPRLFGGTNEIVVAEG